MIKYLPKLHQLKVFQEVIHYGSIRAAARAMNQSQPALTRNIRELEQILGTALMTRGTRGIELTESGRMFAVRMQLIMEELQRATDEIKQLNQQTQGNLSIGFSSLIALSVFPQAAEQFKKYHPQTTLRIKEAQLSALLPALWEGRLDFAIGTISSEVPLSDFIEEPLFKARFGIICRKGHPLENCTSLAQLRDAKWFFPETDMGYYKQIGFIFDALHGERKQRPVLSDSLICGWNMILNSDYLTVIALDMAGALGLKSQLSIIPIKESFPLATYSLVYSRKTPLTLTARKMIDILRWDCQKYNWHS